MTGAELETMIHDCMDLKWVWESKMDYTLSLCLARAVARNMQDRCARIAEEKGCNHNGCFEEFGHDSLCPLAIAKAMRSSEKQ